MSYSGIGRIRRGSIEYVPARPVRPSRWDYRCVLLVESVIKGTWRERELPVTNHYGLTPVVGGYEKRLNHMINLRGNRKDYPEDMPAALLAKDTTRYIMQHIVGKPNQCVHATLSIVDSSSPFFLSMSSMSLIFNPFCLLNHLTAIYIPA